jgi:hypothetical protein
VDEIPYGTEVHGDLVITGEGNIPWYLERIIALSPGNHSVKLQIQTEVGWIYWLDLDYGAARMFVQAW